MSNDRSITDQKATFIRSQIRLLSAPLSPSPAWHDAAPLPTSEDDPHQSLGPKVVQDIVDKLNNKLRAHNRLVYSSQSQRHVAEQIDALYWNEVAADTAEIDKGATWVKRKADLCDVGVIGSLPEDWRLLYGDGVDVQSSLSVGDEDIEKFDRLRRRLAELHAQQAEQAQKLAMYKKLDELMSPFENARENVQPNLVTKDGELSKELERMRMLIAKVVSKADQLRVTGEQGNMAGTESVGVSHEDKLAQLLEGG